jgi:DNA-binding transcriptional MerR regulator
MRQLDLFGIETEPQKSAPSQLRKAAMALRATPPSPVSDTTTLVFADNKIGIKIKLKREITLTDDTTQAPPASPATEQEPVALQQLTLEEAILALTREAAVEETAREAEPEAAVQEEEMPEPVAEEMPLPEMAAAAAAVEEITEIPVEEPTPVMAHQPLVRPAIISIEEEAPEVTAVAETVPVSETADLPVEEIAAAPVAAQQWLVRPAIISVEEEEAPEAKAVAETAVLPVEEIAEEPVAAIAVEQVAEAEPAVEAVLPEIAVPVVADAIAEVAEQEMPVAAAPTPAPLAARSQLVRPAIIEIEEEEEATEQEMPVAEEVPPAIEAVQEEVIVAAEEPVTETAAITAAPEESVPAAEEVFVAAVPVAVATEAETIPTEPEEVIVAAPAPVAAEPVVVPPAKIKAPKPIREPALPKKRGRKSFKEIDAETDMLQLPDDEALFEKQYYPISVVAGWFNVNASLLRFWENEFDILKPRKNRKGDRLFRPEDVKNLQVIYYLLRQRKFTIEGAKEYLKTNKKKADTNTQLIQSLTKLRGFLLEFKANLHP